MQTELLSILNIHYHYLSLRECVKGVTRIVVKIPVVIIYLFGVIFQNAR